MTTSSSTESAILWGVVEEHLEEAEFLLEQFERALVSATQSVSDLSLRLEPRLLAHLDGLRVGGGEAFERLLQPILAEPDPDQPARLCVAAMLAIDNERFDALAAVLGHEASSVRSTAVRAFHLASDDRADAWLSKRLREALPLRTRATLLDSIAARRLAAPTLIEWLQTEDLDLLRAAARAAARADPRLHGPVVESLLEHEDEEVQQAAMLAALAWGSPRAWAKLAPWALEPDRPRALAMALCAALGDDGHHERLARLVDRKPHRYDALFALGFSGSPSQLAKLLEAIEAPVDPLAAKIASQAIATISGIDLRDPVLAAPVAPASATAPEEDLEAARALPPLEEDDLDADLVPRPEAELPNLNPLAIRRACQSCLAQAAKGTRVLGGRPLTPEGVASFLEHAPLGQRHAVAMAIRIRTGGSVEIDTRGFVDQQRRDLAMLRRLDPRAMGRVAPRY